MKTVTYTFSSYRKFENFVRFLPLSDQEQAEILEHERAHMEAAERLGYSGKYEIEELIPERGFRKCQPRFVLDTEVKNLEHIEAILMAPKNPSETDYVQLEKCKKCRITR